MNLTHDNITSAMRVERKEQGATRQNILQLLRRQGQMTAIELSQSLRIGAVGVRQHLALLERDGLVEVSDLRRSVGRPSHLYTLTPEAERYFPKNYDKLALDVLQQVEEQYGEEAVETILTARRKKIAQKIAPRLAGKSLTEKVLELTHILADMGYMCEYQQYDDGTHVIIEHNCPIDCIARLHPQFCMHEIELYKELLDVGIDRDSTIASDGSCCRYIISASELCVDNDSMSEPCVDNDSMTEQ